MGQDTPNKRAETDTRSASPSEVTGSPPFPPLPLAPSVIGSKAPPLPGGRLSAPAAAMQAAFSGVSASSTPVAEIAESVENLEMKTTPAAAEVEPPAADADGQPTRRAARRRPAGPARTKMAANDDIPTIGALIYALEQKPSREPFKYAAYATGAWLGLGLVFSYATLSAEISRSTGVWDLLARPNLMGLAATVLLPIGVFWFMAMLVWRAQELRLMSSAMTEVAVRLAEPDRNAEQSVTSLGQTVRKQVNFMNEAVTRAIGRAGELEAMVHSEVSSLERSFQDNEKRIRGVLAELASERIQLVNTSSEVHGTLRAMGDEVPALIEKLNGQQGKLARIIESAGQNLIALEGSLLKASDKLEGSLGVVSDKVEGTIQLASEKIEGALSDRTVHLQQVLDEYTGAINLALGDRTTEIQTVFDEYTRALDATLIARTEALDGAFAERVRLFDESILRSTSTIDSVIGEKAHALSAAMDSHARNLADTLGRQSSDIDETLMHGIDAVRRSSENITRQSVKAIEGLSSQADMLRNVSENLLGQIGSVTNRFENQGQAIMRSANALETANFRIDSTLQTRHRELNETLGKLTGKAGELDEVMRGYSANIEGSMSEAEKRARSLTQELSKGAETHARSTLADLERMRAETEAQASRTLQDMHQQFSSVGREMSNQMGTLSSRLHETSEDLRQKTQRAAAELMVEQERLRVEAERIPVATRESTEAMRRILNEQIRALDKLSTLSGREAMQRDVMPPTPLVGSPAPVRQGAPMSAERSLPPPASLATAWAEQQTRTPHYPQSSTPPLQQQPYPQQHQHVPPAAPPATLAQQQAQPGRWSLGDLLARASNEPQQGNSTPPHATSSGPAANGGSINLEVIASAMDADTAAAIWSRYRAGQRGIMVRSIYTAEGRNTFDEVSRRYAGEEAFRRTVDRFLADFERLLRESEARDASGRTVEGHLSSPSGRTYLFLAHAAGRLN